MPVQAGFFRLLVLQTGGLIEGWRHFHLKNVSTLFAFFTYPARVCGFFRLSFCESEESKGLYATAHSEIAWGEVAYGVEPVVHLCRCEGRHVSGADNVGGAGGGVA